MYMSLTFSPKEFTMSSYNSVFHYGNKFYASPYSGCDVDFMDGAIVICGEFSSISNERLTRLLNEILTYSNSILYSGEGGNWTQYKRYCLRKLYSLEVRLQKCVGQYACNSILMSMNCLPIVTIERL